MHRQFRQHLDKARGKSEFVLAVNLDIRGFSDWSRRVESRETILYLTKIYPKLIDAYFSDRWFFKPTGDGLLLVRAFEEPELPSLVEKTVIGCFDIIDSFSALGEGEPMINFETPSEVGIGLAQGAASLIAAPDPTNDENELILDYSGRVLNLASRLMELARPRGVVMDSGFGSGLIPVEIARRLKAETGYIRGVSPEDEVRVLFDPELTQIPESFKQKPGEVDWGSSVRNYTLRELEKHATPHLFQLEQEPTYPNKIKCKVTHPAISKSGQRIKGLQHTRSFRYEFYIDGQAPTVRVDFPELSRLLRSEGVKGPWPISVRVEYPI